MKSAHDHRSPISSVKRLNSLELPNEDKPLTEESKLLNEKGFPRRNFLGMGKLALISLQGH